jgi:chloramphenicol-sensitive protein RarD
MECPITVLERERPIMISDTSPSARQGLAYGIAAYGLWGLVPLYFKAVARVRPFEVLAHRVVWSCCLLALVVVVAGQWKQVRLVLQNRRAIVMLSLSTLLIAVNWLVVINAVSTGQVLQASLGYYLAPLVNAPLGIVALGERLGKLQVAGVLLAALAVTVPILSSATFPWIAITLALSFSMYGLLRKTMPVGGLVGLSFETMLLTPAAVLFLALAGKTGPVADTPTFGLLMTSGIVTSVPLLLFVGAARRLKLSTLGFVQYLSPSVSFLLAVFAFGEPFGRGQLVTFACIWAGVIVYSIGALRTAGTGDAASSIARKRIQLNDYCEFQHAANAAK